MILNYGCVGECVLTVVISGTDYHVSPIDWHTIKEGLFEGSEDCDSSRKSVMALAVTCSLLLVLYVCTVFCMCTSRKFLGKDKTRGLDSVNYFNAGSYLR